MRRTKRGPTEFDRKMGKMLRIQRKLRGMTQEEVGNLIGVSYQQMQKYETGINRISVETLSNFAGIYGSQVWELAKSIEEGMQVPDDHPATRSLVTSFTKLGNAQKNAVMAFIRTVAAEGVAA